MEISKPSQLTDLVNSLIVPEGFRTILSVITQASQAMQKCGLVGIQDAALWGTGERLRAFSHYSRYQMPG